MRALATLVAYSRWLDTPAIGSGTAGGRSRASTPGDAGDPRQGSCRSRTAVPGTGGRTPICAKSAGVLRDPAVGFVDRVHETQRCPSEQIGYPIVLKTAHPGLAHRPDLGGVRVNLENEAAVRTAYLSMIATLPPEAQKRLILQHQAPAGVACVVESARTRCSAGGVLRDRRRGHTIAGDRGYRIPAPDRPRRRRPDQGPKAAPRCSATATRRRWTSSCSPGCCTGWAAGRFAEITRLELNPIIMSSRAMAGGCLGVVRAGHDQSRPRGPAATRLKTSIGGQPHVEWSGNAKNELMATPAPAQPTLAEAIERTGYYPDVVQDVLDNALVGEAVQDFIVQHETTFDRADEIRRHITVLLLTRNRLLVVHVDEHSDGSRPATSRRRQRPNPCPEEDRSGRCATSRQQSSHTSGPAMLQRSGLTVIWGKPEPHRDLEPATCGDPQCEADHGYTGALAMDDWSLRVSRAADGDDVVRATMRFAAR